jgi:hypothetical protein
MEAIRRADGRYAVFIPARLSPTGKRQAKYFKYRTSGRENRDSAEKFIAEFQANRREHGNAAVTAEERHWINIARAKLGSLVKLGEVLEHWRKTGANIRSISARDAVEEFIRWNHGSLFGFPIIRKVESSAALSSNCLIKHSHHCSLLLLLGIQHRL